MLSQTVGFVNLQDTIPRNPHEKLSNLQDSYELLTTRLKEYSSHANADLKNNSAPEGRHFILYHTVYDKAKLFYNSEEFEEAEVKKFEAKL